MGKEQIKATMKDYMGSDLSVVNAARVSFGAEAPHLREKDKKLIKYLADHEHISPFGHCFASFHVSAPIFVARQLVKHKFLRWNEISRRYVDYTPELYMPERLCKRPEGSIKQGSGGTHPVSEALLKDLYNGSMGALATYERLIDEGVSPEEARMVLPLNTMTEWYWSGSLDAFADMVVLRDSDDVQKETRWVAQDISQSMKERFPVSWVALTEEG